MKRRITGILLALLMALALLPATAWAEETEVPCYWFRDKEGYTSVGLPPELPGVTWDQENEVLTLNNAHLTKSVYVPSDATVVLIGDNTITVASTTDYQCGLDGYGCRRHEDATAKTLKIKGPGTLTIQTSDVAYEYCFGLYATSHLALSDGCTVKITAGGASEVKYDSFYRKDMSYSYGIRTNKIDVDADCTLEVTSGTAVRSWAIYCTDATINGEVTVTSGTADESSGIYAVGTVTINDTAYVKAYGAIDNYDKEGYNKPEYVIVAENATVIGAKEEFVSGQSKHLTPANSGQPIEIVFNRIPTPRFTYSDYDASTGSMTVTITCTSPDAEIYYTLDPNGVPDTLYTGPIVLTGAATIKAVAKDKTNTKADSAVAAKTFTDSYTVTIVPDSTVVADADSVSRLTQKVSRGNPIDNLFFHPAEGYYFPENYSASASGIQVKRMHSGAIQVSGIPENDVTLTLPAASEALKGTVTISGTPKVGQTLTAVSNITNPSGETLYQWYYNNGATMSAIPGATGSTYVPTANDVGQKIFVAVGDSNRPGSLILSSSVDVVGTDDNTPVDPTPTPTPNPGNTSSGGNTSTGPSVAPVKTADEVKSASNYSGGIYGLTFQFSGSYSSFQRVEVDGKAIDADSYIAESNGSGTEIYLKAVFLRTLADGKHTITAVSSAGSASAEFTIGESVITAAKTFDAGVAVYGMSALLALSGMAWLGRKREN